MTSEVIDGVKRLTHLEVRPPGRRLVVRASKGVAVTARPMAATMTTEMDLMIDQEIATWKYTEEEGGTKQGPTAGVRSASVETDPIGMPQSRVLRLLGPQR